MVLEATYLCVDNSDYMRNGDFAPSRMEAQQDAVNLLAGAKTQAHAPPRSRTDCDCGRMGFFLPKG